MLLGIKALSASIGIFRRFGEMRMDLLSVPPLY